MFSTKNAAFYPHNVPMSHTVLKASIHYFPQQHSQFGLLIEAHCVIREVPTDSLHTFWINFSIHRRPGFDLRPVHVTFMLGQVALGQVFLRVLQFSSVSIIPPILHTHLHFSTTKAKWRSLQSLGTEYFHTSLSSKGQPYVVNKT